MKTGSSSQPGFTLVELMVVIGIMGAILAMGAPPFFRIWKKEGMRKVLSEVCEVCANARRQAILQGKNVDVVFRPLEHRLSVSGGGAAPAPAEGTPAAGKPSSPARSAWAATLPDDVIIEMLDINFMEFNQSEEAHVRFFPNGTSWEMTLILHSTSKNEWHKISLEAVTGLATVETIR